METKLICPECDHMQDVPDDFDETGCIHQIVCKNCKKIFGFELEYVPVYIERPLPCRNGDPHIFNMTKYHRLGYAEGDCLFCLKIKHIEIDHDDLDLESYILKEGD
jgi:hypothetical protein